MAAGPPGRVGRDVRRAALALLATASLAGGLSACAGGDAPSAQVLLSQTFRSHRPIESGQIELSFTVSSLGAGGSRGPQALAVQLQGPFENLGAGRLPSFALQIGLRSASLFGAHALQAGLTSTDGQLFIELAGASFAAPAATVQALEQGYARATGSASPSARKSTFALLGVEPGEWLVKPTIVGRADVAGVETTHISAGLDSARFLADAQRLAGAGGALGLAGSGPAALISPGEISSLAGSVRSAHVDLYTGEHDHLLRRIYVQGTIATTPQTRAALGGRSGATLALTLQFADLNAPQTITAPSNPQPISGLLGALQRLGLLAGTPSSG